MLVGSIQKDWNKILICMVMLLNCLFIGLLFSLVYLEEFEGIVSRCCSVSGIKDLVLGYAYP
jgi:hypothetical protein